MASVVGKTIFSDGKGKLFFGYYKTDDAVEFVDYKTWKKLSFKDVSKGDTNKERVIKAILKNQKQFNKKVDFNMWAKKQRRSFEDTMDWFIQNGWINNINKGGIKESVDALSVNEGISVFDERHFGKKGIIIMIDDNGKKVSAIFKDKKNADKYNRNNPSDIKKLLDLAKKTKYPNAIDESVNEDRNSNMFYVLYQKKGVFGKPAAAGYKDRKDAEKFAKSLGNNHNTMILDKQSMKNVKGVDVNESAGKEAMGIAALTGTRGSAVQDFIDKNRINSKKLFKALKSANLQGRINFANGLAGKPGNPNEKLTIKLFGESVNEGKKRFKQQNGIGKSKYTISYHDGKKKHKDGSDFFDIKIFKNKKDLSDFVGTLAKQGYKLTRESVNESNESVNEAKFGYKDSTASYINKHKDEYKQAEKMNKGNEKRFYDMLQQMEEKVGHGKTMLFISNALRGYGVDMFKDPKIKNPQDAQEALYLLSK